MTSPLTKSIWLWVMLASIGLLYLLSIPQHLTWANWSTDSAELITASVVDGVAHPSGYPLYLFLTKPLRYIPIASVPWRFGFFSVLCTLGASCLFFATVRSLTSDYENQWIRVPVAAFGAVFFALTPLVWSQAIIAEVYALHLLVVALVVWIIVNLQQAPTSELLIFALWLTVGVGMSNHVSTALLFPIIIVSLWTHFRVRRQNQLHIRAMAVGAVVMGAFYAMLLWRATQQPPINWGAMQSLRDLGWLISGELYQDRLFAVNRMQVLGRLRSVPALVTQANGIALGLLLALVGVSSLWRRHARSALITMIGLLFLAGGFALSYGVIDYQPHLLPALYAICLLMTIGLSQLATYLDARHVTAALGLCVVCVGLLGLHGWRSWQFVSLRNDIGATVYVEKVIAEAPQDAIIITSTDQALFPLWYAKYVAQQRPDISVIHNGLWPHDWYQTMLRADPANHELPTVTTATVDALSQATQRPVCQTRYEHWPTTPLACP